MPADQRDRRAHPDADAPRAGATLLNRRATRIAAIAVGAVLAAFTAPAAAPPRTSPAAILPELAVGAAKDLADIYRAAIEPGDQAPALAARLDAGIADLRRATLAGNRDSDPLLESTQAQNSALLLRMRSLEAVAAACGRDLEAVRLAARAESLEAALRLEIDELRPALGSLLPLAAGLRPSRAEAGRILPALEATWRQRCAGDVEGLDGPATFLLLHALADRDPAALAALWRPRSRSGWDAALGALGSALQSGRVRLVVADDPLRRLRSGARTLAAGGVVPASLAERVPATLEVADDAGDAALRTALDSLAAEFGLPRTSPILGSRRDYYRRTGELAPILQPADEVLARDVAMAAIEDLRALLDDAALRRAGLRVASEVEPVEVVPGQQVAVAWTIDAASAGRFTSSRAGIAGSRAPLRDPEVALAPGRSAVVRTGFVTVPVCDVGSVLALDLDLEGTLDNRGRVVARDRVAVRVVAPVQGTLVAVGDPLFDRGKRSVEAIVTSRAPHPVRGMIRVLATTDWKIGPAEAFRFALLRPGQSARARIDLDLPPLASPGPYELRVRLDVDGKPTGILSTRLVKPIEWVVVGPFPSPRPGQALPPENGASLAARYRGLGGRQVAWRVAPRDAYDPDGGLDLAALFPDVQGDASACAFSVVESPEVAPVVLRAAGGARMLWNGKPVPPDGNVRLDSGRNTLIVRSRSDPAGWRVLVELRDPRGEPLRVLANDLARILDGYAELQKAPRSGGRGEPPDRIVVLSFQGAIPAQEVAVLGSFNAWVPHEFERQPDGSWQRTLRLAPGRYAYKLLVDGRLRPDPAAAITEPDGFGGRNSLLIVR